MCVKFLKSLIQKSKNLDWGLESLSRNKFKKRKKCPTDLREIWGLCPGRETA